MVKHMDEKDFIDKISWYVGLYKKFQKTEDEVKFYEYLEALRKFKGLSTQDEALDFANEFMEGAMAA